jgi:hypothetical protein
MANPLALPTRPDSARVFFGYRAQALRESPGDDAAAKARKRTQFFDWLGHTFMPGTPLMQMPLGLSAYLPAVIDPAADANLPDEAAIIVYVSLPVYQSTRETSLSRRMYTRSHAAVFDMDRSPAGFPANIDTPAKVASGAGELSLWYLFDAPTDWQDGDARFLFIVAGADGADIRTALRDTVRGAANALRQQGCDQVIAGSAPHFAALWLHSADDAAPIDAAKLVPPGASIMHDFHFSPAWVHGDAEKGVTITKASAFNFRFSRDMRFFAS